MFRIAPESEVPISEIVYVPILLVHDESFYSKIGSSDISKLGSTVTGAIRTVGQSYLLELNTYQIASTKSNGSETYRTVLNRAVSLANTAIKALSTNYRIKFSRVFVSSFYWFDINSRATMYSGGQDIGTAQDIEFSQTGSLGMFNIISLRTDGSSYFTTFNMSTNTYTNKSLDIMPANHEVIISISLYRKYI